MCWRVLNPAKNDGIFNCFAFVEKINTLTHLRATFKLRWLTLKLLASPKSRTAQSVNTCIHAACANYPSSGNIQMSFWQKQEDAIPNPPLNSIVINCFAPQLLPTIETKPPNV